jgi:hypothetical protein
MSGSGDAVFGARAPSANFVVPWFSLLAATGAELVSFESATSPAALSVTIVGAGAPATESTHADISRSVARRPVSLGVAFAAAATAAACFCAGGGATTVVNCAPAVNAGTAIIAASASTFRICISRCLLVSAPLRGIPHAALQEIGHIGSSRSSFAVRMTE